MDSSLDDHSFFIIFANKVTKMKKNCWNLAAETFEVELRVSIQRRSSSWKNPRLTLIVNTNRMMENPSLLRRLLEA